ncbi:hypothetical protein [Gracilimonas sp.]|uniref:hypothetical protein n=1 Tax=Gracilimonas sp. TaxID=1974203 RepID=UPI0032EEBB38
MVKSFIPIIVLIFIWANSALAQNAEEIQSQQKEVILHFYQLLLQETPVTVSQAHEIFNPEQMWNIEYYDESLSAEQKSAFYDGDPDTLISRTFKKIDNYKSDLIPNYSSETSFSELIESFTIELINSRGDEQIRVNQYQVISSIDENWKVIFDFYGHPFQQISKIIIGERKDILKEIGLSD